jgi:signal transduction histidine kinase
MNEMPKENLSVLVIEDDPGDFGLVKTYLRQAGLTHVGDTESVLWAKTLAEGISATRRAMPDVVLLDLSLPDSAGLATVRAMRAAVPDTPIVVLTGHDEKTLALATLESGAQDYLVKGQFDNDALGRALRYALVRGKLEQRLVQHQQHLEEMVRARTIELARALEAAQAASRAKSTFLANMSHEIRTPLNGIIGIVSLLMRSANDGKQHDRLSIVDASAHRLLNVLGNILDMARIEAGKMAIEERAFDPALLLLEVLSSLENQAGKKGLSLVMDCDAELPTQLLGDPLRIKQVLFNLADNGVKFTAHGRVTLGLRLKSSDTLTAQLQFFVADTGIGIAATDIERVVQTFEQADNSSTRTHGGSGLGLPISRNLVNLMGSELDISSILGQGSTFSFDIALKIPAHVAPPSADKTAVASPRPQKVSELSGAHILVAEDDAFNLEVVQELLSMEGVIVDLATNGEQAVDLARRNPYQAILLDLQMPVLNGIEACALIRQIAHHATTPILGLTSGTLADSRQECRQAGIDEQIAKPYDPQQLFALIEHWLQVAEAAKIAART